MGCSFGRAGSVENAKVKAPYLLLSSTVVDRWRHFEDDIGVMILGGLGHGVLGSNMA